jgi:Ser/Thr protein kinase RdoA (MazF antagonist)
MGREVVAADWPRLAVAALAPVVAAYPGLGPVRDVAWHSQRPFAASGILRCAAGEVFAKRHDPRVRDVADLVEEHRFIAHLRAAGAAVPRVLANAAGETAMAGPGGVYELHALGQGEDAYRDAQSWTPARGVADAEAAGRALGLLHVAAAGFCAPARRTRLVVAGDAVMRAADPLAALEGWVAGDARLAAALAGRDWRADFGRVLRPLYAALAPFRAALSPCWVHGDFHVSNLLWRDGAVSAVLDFGLSNRASAVFDLATAIERNAIAWLALGQAEADIGRADLARALIGGYAAVADFGAAPRAALRRVLPVVHVEFALSELAYFHGVTGSAVNAGLAYDDFLLGHAAWFGTRAGQAFLDGIG